MTYSGPRQVLRGGAHHSAHLRTRVADTRLRAWEGGKSLSGVHIHKLGAMGLQSARGSNPFWQFTVGRPKTRLSTLVQAYDPPRTTSSGAYKWIEANLPAIIEEAIEIRKAFAG